MPNSLPTTLTDAIDRFSAACRDTVVATRRDLHRHPELGFRETRTAALVAARLREIGFDEVRTGVGGTGVIGLLKGGRPGRVVALRADMDALPIEETIDVPYRSIVPGVKHACGHDAHTAIALGAAEVLGRIRADLPGAVKFLFQPAEEGDPDLGSSGAVRLIEAGALRDPAPSAIFGLHVIPAIPAGLIGLHRGPAMASESSFTITIRGRKTHGAYPHTGLDPVPIAAQAILALQTIPSRLVDAQQPTVVSIGIVEGGNRPNIVAESVRLVGTVRSLARDGQATVREKMQAIVGGITGGYGATCEFEHDAWPTPVVFNDAALYDRSRTVLEQVAGAGHVVTLPVQMGAEDFACYQQEVPGIFFFLGVRNDAKGVSSMLHTEAFDVDEEALPLGVRALATLAADHLVRADEEA